MIKTPTIGLIELREVHTERRNETFLIFYSPNIKSSQKPRVPPSALVFECAEEEWVFYVS